MTALPGRARRSAAFAALVGAVVLLHVVLTRELAERMAQLELERAMPARIAVAYVRTLEPEVPAAAAVPPAPARSTARRLRAPRPVAPASAVQPAASEPEPAAVVAAAPEATAPAEPALAPASDPALALAPASDPALALAPASDPAPPLAPATDPSPGVAPDLLAAAGSASAPNGLAAADAASAPIGAAFYWPSATRVSYVLSGNYRGEVTGRAEVEWIRIGDRYQVHLDVVVGPEFAPVISRKMTSEGRLSESGLAPDRYDEETQVMFRDRRRASVVFEDEAVVLANGQRRVRLPGVQDAASQFIQFTWLFGTRPELLRIGNSFEVPLAVARNMDTWIYDVVDEQTLQTSFGPLAALRLKPRRARKANELSAEIWFAPELRFLPVRIRIEQDAATFLDLMIAKKPEISAS